MLGTCVSVCLWEPASGIGGLNHFLLPHLTTGREQSTRFGNVAIEQLIDQLRTLGAKTNGLQAKVFGGKSSSPALHFPERDLGANNAALAFRTLDALRIPVIARDTGGTRGRKLVFHTADGSAWVKQL